MSKKRPGRVRRWIPGLLLLSPAALLPACARVTLDQTKPLEINVNVRLQIDRELDEFFAFQDRGGNTTTPPGNAATQPATQPAAAS